MQTWTVTRLSARGLEIVRDTFASLEMCRRFKQEEQESLYALGNFLMKQGMHDKAQTVFFVLRAYHPVEYRYVLAHALCLKQRTLFEDALEELRVAAMLEPDSPEPLMHAAECLIASDRADEGIGLLPQVIALSEGKEKFRAIGERAEGWLALSGD